VVAIDAKHGSTRTGPGGRNDGWEVYTYGGRKPTGLDVVGYAVEAVARGAGEILLTSMDRDGAKTGYDVELLKAVSSAVTVPVIASGGAGNAGHMVDAVKAGGASAVLAASIFHFGEVSISEVKAAMAAEGVPVRRTDLAA
jgi:cyclase